MYWNDELDREIAEEVARERIEDEEKEERKTHPLPSMSAQPQDRSASRTSRISRRKAGNRRSRLSVCRSRLAHRRSLQLRRRKRDLDHPASPRPWDQTAGGIDRRIDSQAVDLSVAVLIVIGVMLAATLAAAQWIGLL